MLNIRTFEGSKKKQSHEIYPEKKNKTKKQSAFTHWAVLEPQLNVVEN